jgi:hypothetical protein
MQNFLRILGLFSGIVCFVLAWQHLFFANSIDNLSIYDAGTLKSLKIATIPLSLIGISGGFKSMTDDKTGAKQMLFSSFGFFFLSDTRYHVSCIVLFLCGVGSLILLNIKKSE